MEQTNNDVSGNAANEEQKQDTVAQNDAPAAAETQDSEGETQQSDNNASDESTDA